MQISVAGQQIELSNALRSRVAHQLEALVDTYFGDALDANVTFGRARSFCTCDIAMHAGQGLVVRGEGEAADAAGAFDDAAEHIARRLRRYRRQMNDHARALPHRRRPEIGRQYILRQEDETLLEIGGGLPARPAAYATIIARQETQIGTLTVSEAVMQLDLADRPVLMFRNSASGGINVVFRRPDGHVVWLDPDEPML
jgi:ribosomal subunit interface protein